VDIRDDLKYIYLNKINLALKSSFQTKAGVGTSEALKVMRSLHSDFQRCDHKISEVFVKTRSDGWVVGRHAIETQREYFVVLEDVLNNEFSDVHGKILFAPKAYLKVFVRHCERFRQEFSE
jgi:hypothetical protein